MDAPYSGKLRIWEGWTAAAVRELPLPDPAHCLPGPHSPAEFANRLYACESLNPRPNRPGKNEGAEPYSLQWYLNIENQRHRRQGRWIPGLLEFSKHSGETLLGLEQYGYRRGQFVNATLPADKMAIFVYNREGANFWGMALLRSLIDWLSEFYGPKRNPYLRLNEADRAKLDIRATVCFLIIAVVFALWRWLHS